MKGLQNNLGPTTYTINAYPKTQIIHHDKDFEKVNFHRMKHAGDTCMNDPLTITGK
jgi:hypothetical protein